MGQARGHAAATKRASAAHSELERASAARSEPVAVSAARSEAERDSAARSEPDRAVESDRHGSALLRLENSQILFMSDPAHDIKSMRNGIKNHWMRIRGQLVGMRDLEVAWHDVDTDRRRAVRNMTTRRVIVARNKFSDTDAIGAFEKDITDALGDSVGDGNLVVTLGPEPYRNPAINPIGAYSSPYGVCWEPKSGFLLYTDPSQGALRMLKMMDVPATNVLISGGLGEVTGVCVVNQYAIVTSLVVPGKTAGRGAIHIIDCRTQLNRTARRSIEKDKDAEPAGVPSSVQPQYRFRIPLTFEIG